MANEFFTEKEYKKYYKQIKEMLINKKDKDSIHLATLVGGQPGSGKSELTKFIQAEDKNAIMIDGDFILVYRKSRVILELITQRSRNHLLIEWWSN